MKRIQREEFGNISSDKNSKVPSVKDVEVKLYGIVLLMQTATQPPRDKRSERTMLKDLKISGNTRLSELCDRLSVINITSEHILNISLNASHDLLAILRVLNIAASNELVLQFVTT